MQNDARSYNFESRLAQEAKTYPKEIKSWKDTYFLHVTMKFSISVRFPGSLQWNGLKSLGVAETQTAFPMALAL